MLRCIDAEQTDALAVNLDCIAVGGLADDVRRERSRREEQYRERRERD
jgi:hypothetical protein